jgi:hypothetical protein
MNALQIQLLVLLTLLASFLAMAHLTIGFFDGH